MATVALKGTAAATARGVWNTHCSGPRVCISRVHVHVAVLTVKPGMDTLGSISSRAEVGWYECCASTDQEQFGVFAVAKETPFSRVH
jgi:hypothetical protein